MGWVASVNSIIKLTKSRNTSNSKAITFVLLIGALFLLPLNASIWTNATSKTVRYSTTMTKEGIYMIHYMSSRVFIVKSKLLQHTFCVCRIKFISANYLLLFFFNWAFKQTYFQSMLHVVCTVQCLL